MTEKADLVREMDFIAKFMTHGQGEIATFCYAENAQAVADLANKYGYVCTFTTNAAKPDRRSVHMTKRQRMKRPKKVLLD